MLSDDMLGPRWKWSMRVPWKVRKSGAANIKYADGVYQISPGRNTGLHGTFYLRPRAYPYLGLIALTHYYHEVLSLLKSI